MHFYSFSFPDCSLRPGWKKTKNVEVSIVIIFFKKHLKPLKSKYLQKLKSH